MSSRRVGVEFGGRVDGFSGLVGELFDFYGGGDGCDGGALGWSGRRGGGRGFCWSHEVSVRW